VDKAGRERARRQGGGGLFVRRRRSCKDFSLFQ
jgi:hypothetical protein